ncbi:efflux RND transporter permease subunit [Marinilabiliaceae bacterium JC017]|nr:efflux RND transporter permease subunit [Marinilabiliaceae bacterium JC017]
MRKLIETFVKYPFYANLIVVVLIGAGWASFSSMKKAFFPERPTREVYISVAYPGASPKEMEEGITMRIEEAIRGLPGIKEMNSTSSENFCRVAIETTGQYAIDEMLQEIKNAVDGITSLPVDAERPIVYKRRSTTPAIRLGLSGSADLMTLKQLAYQIEDDFLASGYISQINMGGFPSTEISVEISEENLLRYNLTLKDVSAAIARTNRDISGGQVKNKQHFMIIRARNRSVNAADIGNIVIRADANGSMVHIRDIGKVKIQFEDVPRTTLLNGENAISISINKLISEDLEEISEYVNEYVDEFNARYNNAHIHVTFDFLDMLHSRINLLYSNGLIGLVLVVIILALFLSFRLSLWVAWGIPSSFLAMFVVANMYGITINMISLFGMILVVGILVDDGIVIAENIFSHFENGKSPMKAAVDGTMEVLPAVTTSVITTLLAFSPLLFIEGSMEFLYEMAFVVVFSLGFSLIEAFFVLPTHIGTPHILKRNTKDVSLGNKIRNQLESMVFFLREKLYGKLLRGIIHWRYVALFVPVTLILITAGLFNGGFIASTFFPNIPPDNFNVNVSFTPGEGEQQTYETLQHFEKVVWQVNEELKETYNDTSDYIIYTFLTLGSAFDGQESGSHAGHVAVNLRNMENSPISTFEIAAQIREKIGSIPEAEKFSVAGRNRWGSPVAISLLGSNLDELSISRDVLMDELKKMTQLTEVVDNNPLGAQEIRLKLKSKAYFLGLDYFTILNQIRNGFFGAQSQRLQLGKDELRVWVRYPPSDRQEIGQLEEIKIKTPQGDYPLREVADYKLARGPVSIHRYNGKREIRVDADLVDPYAPVPPLLATIQDSIMPKITSQFPGVRYVFQGQQKNAAESQRSMMKYFIPAFILIAIVIMIHFRSFGQGLIILSMVPLGYLGASWGHWIHNIPVSMLSVWGMVALSGVIVNDAVVFLAKYNSLLAKGETVKEAVYKAGIARFRPIVLTTLTTTIGLFPIIFETSRQAQFLIPMAVALAYGVFFGTSFILTIFPTLILFLNDLRVWFKWAIKGVKPSKEEVEKANIYKNRIIQ